MTVAWPIMSLRDAGVTLIDCDHRTPPAASTGYPYITIPNLKDGRIEVSGSRRITAEHFSEWTRKVLPRGGDVVLSRRCNPGETANVPDGLEFALGQNLVLLRTDGVTVDPAFLRWLVRGPEWWAQVQRHLNVGAVFDSLRCADVPRFELCIPPRAQQMIISETLGALDDRIGLNRRMSETLESTARAIFEDLLARAPEGADWEEIPLDSAATFMNGLALQKYPPTPDGSLPVIKIAELRAGVTARTDRASLFVPEPYVIHAGDLLFSWSGTLEVSVWTGPTGALNQHLFKVTSDRFPRWFVRHWLVRHLPEFRAIAAGKATTMGHIQRRHLTAATVLVPPASVLTGAAPALAAIDERIVALALESRTLSELRDTLLPRLLSGELRLRDTEREVANAA